MDSIFRIADFCFRLKLDEEISTPENLRLFEAADGEAEYTYEIELCDHYPKPQGTLTARRKDMMVFTRDGLEMRYLGVEGAPGSYACYEETDERHARVHLARAAATMTIVDPIFLSLLSMERHLIRRDGRPLSGVRNAGGRRLPDGRLDERRAAHSQKAAQGRPGILYRIGCAHAGGL